MKTIILNPVIQPFIPQLSPDGYIRITEQELAYVELHHLESSLYLPEDDRQSTDSIADISGNTEWLSPTQPCISIGWDWQVQHQRGSKTYTMLGLPYSNLLLRHNPQQDFSPQETIARLAIWLNALNWQTQLADYIQTKYS